MPQLFFSYTENLYPYEHLFLNLIYNTDRYHRLVGSFGVDEGLMTNLMT